MGNELEELLDHIREANPEALTADGFDAALIGYVERAGARTVALYDRAKCIAVLMKRDGMGEGEAEEFFEFNVIGAYMGDDTPAFATVLKQE